jgi:hypothetical protein
VDRAVHNADGIMTWYTDASSKSAWNHNFYFYEEKKADGKIWLMPWDLPATLSRTDPIIDDFGMPDWNVKPDTCKPMPIWSGGIAVPPNCDKLTGLLASTIWERFVRVGEQLLAAGMNVGRMQAMVDSLASLIAPAVSADHAIDFNKWKGAVTDLRAAMSQLHSGFNDYLHKKPESFDTAGVTTEFPCEGALRINRINNFEFTQPCSVTTWTYPYISAGSSFTLALDTISPLWGRSDLKFAFSFRPADTAKTYAEWAAAALGFNTPLNLRAVKTLRFCARCDRTRQCRISVFSELYKKNGVAEEYGWYIPISSSNKTYELKRADIAYPSWANPKNPDILDTVLATASAVVFGPQPVWDGSGHLATVPDSGFLKIDNIVFGF